MVSMWTGRLKRFRVFYLKLMKSFSTQVRKNEFFEAEVKLELIQLLLCIYKMSQQDLAHVTSKKTEKEVHAEEIASWIRDHFKEKISLDRSFI